MRQKQSKRQATYSNDQGKFSPAAQQSSGSINKSISEQVSIQAMLESHENSGTRAQAILERIPTVTQLAPLDFDKWKPTGDIENWTMSGDIISWIKSCTSSYWSDKPSFNEINKTLIAWEGIVRRRGIVDKKTGEELQTFVHKNLKWYVETATPPQEP